MDYVRHTCVCLVFLLSHCLICQSFLEQLIHENSLPEAVNDVIKCELQLHLSSGPVRESSVIFMTSLTSSSTFIKAQPLSDHFNGCSLLSVICSFIFFTWNPSTTPLQPEHRAPPHSSNLGNANSKSCSLCLLVSCLWSKPSRIT